MDKRALYLLFALAGCADADSTTRETAASAASAAGRHDVEISEIKDRLSRLEKESQSNAKFLASTYNYLKAVDDGQTSLRKTFNNNVKISNENALKDLTMRGACGVEWTQSNNGQWFQINKKCTDKDLATK